MKTWLGSFLRLYVYNQLPGNIQALEESSYVLIRWLPWQPTSSDHSIVINIVVFGAGSNYIYISNVTKVINNAKWQREYIVFRNDTQVADGRFSCSSCNTYTIEWHLNELTRVIFFLTTPKPMNVLDSILFCRIFRIGKHLSEMKKKTPLFLLPFNSGQNLSQANRFKLIKQFTIN